VKVLHITYTLNPKMGGVAQAVKTLVSELAKKLINNEVATLDDDSSQYPTHDNFIYHPLGPGKGPWRYNAKLYDWLKANNDRFDVVIIHGLWLYYSFAAHKAIFKKHKTNGPRILVMPHGMLDPYFQNAKDRRLKAIRNWFYWKLIEKNVVNDADGLLFTCQTELLLARETFKPYKPRKEYDVGYGIDTPPAFNEEMSSAFYELRPDLINIPYWLFLSRIDSKKGTDLLIDAYIELYQSSHPINKTLPKLVIAGPGLESSYGKMLKNKIEAHPEINEHIIFTGMLTNDSKWGAFYGCEAFVLPSHQENFGIAVVEALACGKPVLISNQVNIWREIIKEGAGIVEDDNAIGAKNLLEKWVAFTEVEKIGMGIKAKATFKNYFAIEKVVQNYTDAFKDSNN
jgi:glycosyltransferase involved in cell wall biosynthesis